MAAGGPGGAARTVSSGRTAFAGREREGTSQGTRSATRRLPAKSRTISG